LQLFGRFKMTESLR